MDDGDSNAAMDPAGDDRQDRWSSLQDATARLGAAAAGETDSVRGCADPSAGSTSRLSRRLVPAPASLVGRTVAEVERDLILETLTHCRGNRTHAARILGISIRTLRNKLNEYGTAGIAVPEPGQVPIAAA